MYSIEHGALPRVWDEWSGSASGYVTRDRVAVVVQRYVPDDKSSGGCRDGCDTGVCTLSCCHRRIVHARLR